MTYKNNNSNLFFTCSLIEYIGRQTNNKRSAVVKQMGKEQIARLFEFADVFHCEPIEKVSDEFITECKITNGTFNNIKNSVFEVPSYWDIGKVYERLIEDISAEKDIIDSIEDVFTSFIDEYISDFNSAVYYQSRQYILESYMAGQLF